MCIWPIESGFHQQKWEASLSSETLVECSGSDVDVVTEVLNFALIFVSYGPELSAAAFLTLPDDWWLLHGLTEDSSRWWWWCFQYSYWRNTGFTLWHWRSEPKVAPKLAQSQHWFAGGVSQTKLPITSTLATIPKHLEKADQFFLIPFGCHGHIQVCTLLRWAHRGSQT